MHLAESKPQAVAAIQVFGKSLTSHLDELKILNSSFTGAHCVWLDDDDLARMADTGARIVHNPVSNLRLGCGIAPVRRMLDKGICVGVGTDGSVSSDNQNMFEAVRLASYVSRALSPDTAEWISAPEALQLGTTGSADVLGFADRIGRIKAGCYADLVLLDVRSVSFVPLNDPVRQIVQSEDSSAVRSVMVGGKWVLEDGQFTTFDYADLCRKAQATAGRLSRVLHENRLLADQIEGIVQCHCLGLAREPYHVERYCGSPTSV
jgi:cytosine/adenosine deaminase-related metal-dependent hydrolase